MELHPLDPLGLAAPDPVDAGWMRRIRHGPMTIQQVLGRGLAEMLAQDERERQAADPFAWALARRPRRRLIDRLLGR